MFQYFGFKTLERSYLLKINGKVVERPQHMLMRVAVGIHGEDIESAIETYNLMSEKLFTHASPTMFNAGTSRPQLSRWETNSLSFYFREFSFNFNIFQLLSSHHGKRFNWRNLWYFEAVCLDLKIGWRDWTKCALHSIYRVSLTKKRVGLVFK